MHLSKNLFYLNCAALRKSMLMISDIGNQKERKSSFVVDDKGIILNIKGPMMKYVILNCERMEFVDFASCREIAALLKKIAEQGIQIYFCALKEKLRNKIAACGVDYIHFKYRENSLCYVLDQIISGDQIKTEYG